jgi:4-cresol dehydrogenase (hydroxylating)
MIARAVSTDLSDAQLDGALDAFRAVVGAENLLTGADALEFRDPFWYRDWQDYDASAVVQPASVEEDQAIVRIADERRVPIWTTSQGRNNGYGGSSPRVKGSVVMNLRRMNRIVEIDEELGYAVVEPGVSFFDLCEALREGGHRLLASIPDLGWGSVIGNSLEHGFTYMPYGSDFAAPCGMEVVLANGELLRTGMGAMPDNSCWHLYKRAFGPMLDQLFMQSNFGVVVKMGLHLMPFPEVIAPIWLNVPRDTDLIPLIDTVRRLLLDRTLEGVTRMYNTLLYASLLEKRTRWYEGEGPTPDHIIDQVARDLGLGRWCLHTALWEDTAVADYKIEKITAAFEQIPGAELRITRHAPEEIAEAGSPSDRVLGGVPQMAFMTMLGWYGTQAAAHLGNGPIAPMVGKEAYRLHTICRDVIENEQQLDYFASPMAISARSYMHACGAIWDINSEEETRLSYETCRRITEETAKAGFGEYRAHLDVMDLVADTYSFGDHAYRRFLERIKDAVDPNGILAPGKQSIWPASYRVPKV